MKGSDNPTVDGGVATMPANQQERLEKIGWVVGFVDGEGCFSVSVVANATMTLGWQVQPVFSVVQGSSSEEALSELVDFFQFGRIQLNKRFDNHREDLCSYRVTSRIELSNVIVPFFQRYQLRTSKRENFEKFSQIIDMMDKRHHLTMTGLKEIATITESMNHRKPSKFLRILRDHTPTLS